MLHPKQKDQQERKGQGTLLIFMGWEREDPLPFHQVQNVYNRFNKLTIF
jgi:hypothetical protein